MSSVNKVLDTYRFDLFKFLFVVFVIVNTIYVSPVRGDTYSLEKGAELEICKQYKLGVEIALLNTTARCERKFLPGFVALKNPKWESLDLWENKDLFKKIYKFSKWGNIGKRHSVLDNETEYNKMVNLWKNNNSLSLQVASIDIDNNKRLDRVLMVTEGSCETSTGAPFYSNLVVLKDMQTIDEEKTMLLDQNILYDKQIGQWVDAKFNIDYMQYDVFMYEGQVYFDKSDIRNDDGLTVYKLDIEGVNEICHMKVIH